MKGFHFITGELQRNESIFESLLSGIDDELRIWKPSPGKWCLLEIVCHLYDEEREDFRARIRHILENPGQEWPSIDPQGWVSSRNYIGQNYDEKLKGFIAERKQSLQWLTGLQDAAWSNAYIHPKFGPMSASMMLANWLAHDELHIRQIVKLKYDYLKSVTGENMDYAGEW